MARRGRRTSIVTVCGLLVLVPLAGPSVWKELCAAYHLRRLRTDFDYFTVLADSSVESSRGMAMRRFAEDPSGATVLVDALEDLQIVPLFEAVYGVTPYVHGEFASSSGFSDQATIDVHGDVVDYVFSWTEEQIVPDTGNAAVNLARWLRFADGFKLQSPYIRERTYSIRAERMDPPTEWRLTVSVTHDDPRAGGRANSAWPSGR